MQVNESKMDCKILQFGQEFDSVIHLIEIRYSDRITFRNGVLQVPSAAMQWEGMATGLTLMLADGRKAEMTVTHFQIVSGYNEVAGALTI